MKRDFQEKLDTLKKQLHELQTEMDQNGYYIEEDTVIENQPALGLFYDITHIYDYYSDDIYLCTHSRGAVEISESDQKELVGSLQKQDYARLEWFLEKHTSLNSTDVVERIQELVEKGQFILENNQLSAYLDLDDDENEQAGIGSFVDNSIFEIRITTRKDIRSTLEKHEDSTYNF